MCLQYYGLDPCHYISSPGLSWDSMLKFTGVELEKISDINVHLFLEKGMKGAISYISKRYARSDYLDFCNLYGWAMSCNYLPYGGHKCLSKEEIKSFNLHSIPENSSVGYILKVDLEYPKELHNLHNDYPLAPEKIEISYDLLSNYCKGIADCYGIKVGGVKKLVPNLGDKKKLCCPL